MKGKTIFFGNHINKKIGGSFIHHPPLLPNVLITGHQGFF
jgi:hypothetical protein